MLLCLTLQTLVYDPTGGEKGWILFLNFLVNVDQNKFTPTLFQISLNVFAMYMSRVSFSLRSKLQMDAIAWKRDLPKN